MSGHSNRTHGMSKTPEWNAWVNMVQRCTNKKSPQWKDYGGRGIKVCDKWKDSFEAFYAHIGPKPMAGLTIDRIDNEKGYEPGNVRWSSCKVQGRNKRSNRIVEWEGEHLLLVELCERMGVKEGNVSGRMRLGHDLKKSITMPLKARGSKQWVEWQGERISLGRLAAKVGLHRDTLAIRLKRGWSLDRAVNTPTGPEGRKVRSQKPVAL